MDHSAANLQRLYAELEIRNAPKRIRVFDLAPTTNWQTSDEHPDNVIRGRLRVVDLAENPHFVSLSYVWGVSSQKRTIYCGDQLVSVTDNCWEALRHLRYDPTRTDSGRNADGTLTLWIDAICINQQDEDEKLHQLPLMREIYTKAFSGCIWLGCGSDTSDEAMEYLAGAAWQKEFIVNEEGNISRRRTHRNGPWTVALFLLFLITMKQIMELLGLNARRFQFRSLWERYGYPYTSANPYPEGLWEVLRRPWIERIWTLQEAVLSPNPWILCGTRRLAWSPLLLSISHVDCLCKLGLISEKSLGAGQLEKSSPRDICRHWSTMFSLWLNINSSRPHRATTQQINDFHVYTQLHADFVFKIYRHFKTMQTFLKLFTPYVFFVLMAWLGDPESILFIRDSMRLSGSLMARNDRPVYASTFLLREMIRRRATKSEDKLNGILGVMTQMGRKLEPSKGDFRTCFHDLFSCFLDWTLDLNLITFADGSVENQPSWVPNWAKGATDYWMDIANGDFKYTIPEQNTVESDAHGVANSSKRSIYRKMIDCTPGSPSIFHFQGLRILSVTGFYVGTLTATTGPFSPCVDPDLRADSGINNSVLLDMSRIQSVLTASGWLQGDLTLLGPQCRKYMFGDTIDVLKHTVMEHTVHSVRLSKGKFNWPIEAMALYGWAQSMRECLRMSSLEAVAYLKKREKPWRTFQKICSQLSTKDRMFFSCEKSENEGVSTGRSIDRARYFGNGPVHAKVGDVCVLVSGVSVPLILRHHEEKEEYILVGAAIIADEKVMYGDLWRQLVRDRVREQREFRIA